MASPAAGVEFDRNRLSQGELIAAIGAVVLFVAMLMDWYGVKVKTSLGSFGGGLAGPNAWQAFDFIDILLFLTILIVVGVAALRSLNRVPDMPYQPSVLVAIAGAVALLLVLYRFVVQPFDVPDGVDITRKLGIYLGLLSAAAMAFGGWRAMQEAGTSFGDLSASRGGGGAAAGPSAPTTPMPAQGDPGVPGGGAAGVGEGKAGPGAPNPGTSTGGPDDTAGGGPAPAASAGDPVPGKTGSQTPPGLSGEPPAGGGTQPPGL